MGRRCAIKIMMPGTMSDPEAISRFNREAANASRISHPNVCAIYDFGETPDGLIYLAMEFIEGKSLTDVLTEAGTLPLARAAAMIQQSAEALQAAHDLGIVHRDLKPDNIMVTTARGKDTVKLVDFGIAKAIGGDDGKAQKVTKTGFVVGTPEYMSPEQLAGDPVDGRSDLYSLGLVFYRMLTGASPFPADSQQETMIKRLTDEPLPLAVTCPDVKFPPEVQRVLNRALARNPNDRYKHANDFAREVKGLTTHATGEVDVEAGTQKVKAEDLKAMMPATRVDPAAGPPRPKGPPAPGREQAPPAREAKKGLPVAAIAVAVLVLAGGGGALAFKDKLFGGGAPGDGTRGQLPAGGQQPADTHKTDPFSHPDTSKPSVPGPVTPAGGQTTNPPGGTHPTTTTQGNKPPVRIDSVPRPPAGGYPTVPSTKVNVELPPIDDYTSDDATVRARARGEARTVYNRQDVVDSTRAEAAMIVGQTFTMDANFKDAEHWLDLAVRTNPRDLYKRLLADARKNLQRTGN
jgi:serine/threonine-protein kinase